MRDELNRYVPMVSFLGETLGTAFEAVLYDMRDPAWPVLAAANSPAGDQEKIRGFLAEAAGKKSVLEKGCWVNFPLPVSSLKLMKTSVYFIRGQGDEIIGALCLGMRCDFFMKMSSFADSFLRFNTGDPEQDAPQRKELSILEREPTLETIEEYVRESVVDPVRATQDERMELICDLYDAGVYNLKGAVARTAGVFQVSEQSIYRYLAKLKRARDW